ncbi:heme-binding protein [Rhodobacteraceae bacterium CCMM004]|nr:heme-binding protein [Rhodobacteraceae bacterium CCMM004]
MSIFERLYDAWFRDPPDAGERGQGKYKENEAATYTVDQTVDGAELRRYDPMIRAEVRVEGDQETAMDEGFGRLAGYIFGDNAAEEKVAMTVPVLQTNTNRVDVTGGEGVWTVAFMMPSRWTVETLPRPQDGGIVFVEVPGERWLTRMLEDRATPEALEEAEADLRRIAEAEGLTPSGPVRFAFYDDPLTPYWKRRNEVALRVN